MALTATATQGFEFSRYASKQEIMYLPGDPGITYTKGDEARTSYTDGSTGCQILQTDSGGLTVGIVAQTTVCPAATQSFPKPGEFDPVDRTNSANLCLVPVRVMVAEGCKIYKVTFANHLDKTAASYVASTRIVTLGANLTGNADDGNGALCYCYEGTGIGEVNIVEDDDATTGVTFHRKWNATIDSTSKFIFLAGGANGNSVTTSFFGRCDSADQNNLDMNDGADDGDWVIFMGWRESGSLLKNLTVQVIKAADLYIS